MAIKITPASPFTNSIEYLHTKSTFSCRKSYTVLPDSCEALQCRQPIPVFADLDNPTTTRNNDFTKWRYTAPTGGSVECVLTRNCGTTYNITDTTYGAFMDVGDFATYPNDWSFVINWYNVANLIGFGTFYLTFTVKDSSSNTVLEETTPCYYLQPYSCQNANETVRLEVLQKGYNQNGFNWIGFTGLYAFFAQQQIRLNGTIKKTAVTESDYISNDKYQSEHVQTRVSHEYELTLRMVDEYTYENLVKGLLLENPIKLNAYDISNDTTYNDLLVRFTNVDIEEYDRNRQSTVTITLEDYSKDNIKRY